MTPDIPQAIELARQGSQYVRNREQQKEICSALLALAAEREPVKIEDRVGIDDPIDSHGTVHVCQFCKTSPVYRGYKFCPHCGRPIEWEKP
jgi:hypothetical protein